MEDIAQKESENCSFRLVPSENRKMLIEFGKLLRRIGKIASTECADFSFKSGMVL
jgi:hypothetical protein